MLYAMGEFVSALRSFLFYLGYIVSAILAGLLACFFGPFLKLNQRMKLFSLWPRFANWLLYSTCKISVSIEGKENIPNIPCIIISNHQGQWETFYFQYLFHPMVTVLKKELLYIPLWGWGMWFLKPIAINRKKITAALNKIKREGSKRLEAGLSILFFPEGTRNEPGNVSKYSGSAFSLAKTSSVCVLPIVHNSGDCWPAHKFLKRPGTIYLKIGQPLLIKGEPKEAARQAENWTRRCLREIRLKNI